MTEMSPLPVYTDLPVYLVPYFLYSILRSKDIVFCETCLKRKGILQIYLSQGVHFRQVLLYLLPGCGGSGSSVIGSRVGGSGGAGVSGSKMKIRYN